MATTNGSIGQTFSQLCHQLLLAPKEVPPWYTVIVLLSIFAWFGIFWFATGIYTKRQKKSLLALIFFTVLPWLALIMLIIFMIFLFASASGGRGGNITKNDISKGMTYLGNSPMFYYFITFIWFICVLLALLYVTNVLSIKNIEDNC